MKLPGCRQKWYQSRTDCRKPLLLVDVESSVCKIIWKATNYLRKLWVGFFLLLTWYRSKFWVILPCFVCKGFTKLLGSRGWVLPLVLHFRLLLLQSFVSSQNGNSFQWAMVPRWLEHKVPDCAGIQVWWLMWFLNHGRITLSFRVPVHETDL